MSIRSQRVRRFHKNISRLATGETVAILPGQFPDLKKAVPSVRVVRLERELPEKALRLFDPRKKFGHHLDKLRREIVADPQLLAKVYTWKGALVVSRIFAEHARSVAWWVNHLSPEQLQSTPFNFEVEYHRTSSLGERARQWAESLKAGPVAVAKPKAVKPPQKARAATVAPDKVQSVKPKPGRPEKANLAGSVKPISSGLGSRLKSRQPISA